MTYLVDGYNLARNPGFKRVSARETDEVIRFLNRLARAKKTKITVVFDGFSPTSNFRGPLSESFDAVRVLYSGHEMNADQQLRKMIANVSNKRQWIIVSSDRSVHNYARVHGLRAMRSEEFLKDAEQLLHRQAKESTPPTKDEMEYWLNVFGQDK